MFALCPAYLTDLLVHIDIYNMYELNEYLLDSDLAHIVFACTDHTQSTPFTGSAGTGFLGT